MSALFAVEVLAVRRTRIELNVVTVHLHAEPFGQTEGGRWMRENAPRFIAAVKVEPPGLPERIPTGTQARYAIDVTDAKWLAHLSTGQTWRSAAYS